MSRCNNCGLREGKYTVFNQYLNLPSNLMVGGPKKPLHSPKILKLVKHQQMKPSMVSFAISERLCIHCYHAKQNNHKITNDGHNFG
ncbi:putative orfan [Tupanvirus soda lake]|uniref:Orfan n=2 Tax=Tupanvirus TaxID=2094720 RepID=A0AC62ACZ2_9VIRU|nr:putative orfan [Tupanvirus soda lake]QKU35520.1 putative orfan [Tupanvirus soda lake]